MPATYVTGRSLTLTINSVSYADQASSVTMSLENNQQVLEVLSGRAYKTVDKMGTLSVEMFADWNASTGICSALWDAAKNSPDTPIAFSFDANGDLFTGNVYPVFPPAGGAATDVLSTTLEFIIEDGSVTRT